MRDSTRIAWIAACLVLPWLPSGQAYAICEPMSLDQLAQRQEVARAALFEDDLRQVAEVAQRIEEDVPCLMDVVPSESWADHLITLTIYAYNTDADWEPVLRSALEANPAVKPTS